MREQRKIPQKLTKIIMIAWIKRIKNRVILSNFNWILDYIFDWKNMTLEIWQWMTRCNSWLFFKGNDIVYGQFMLFGFAKPSNNCIDTQIMHQSSYTSYECNFDKKNKNQPRRGGPLGLTIRYNRHNSLTLIDLFRVTIFFSNGTMSTQNWYL